MRAAREPPLRRRPLKRKRRTLCFSILRGRRRVLRLQRRILAQVSARQDSVLGTAPALPSGADAAGSKARQPALGSICNLPTTGVSQVMTSLTLTLMLLLGPFWLPPTPVADAPTLQPDGPVDGSAFVDAQAVVVDRDGREHLAFVIAGETIAWRPLPALSLDLKVRCAALPEPAFMWRIAATEARPELALVLGEEAQLFARGGEPACWRAVALDGAPSRKKAKKVSGRIDRELEVPLGALDKALAGAKVSLDAGGISIEYRDESTMPDLTEDFIVSDWTPGPDDRELASFGPWSRKATVSVVRDAEITHVRTLTSEKGHGNPAEMGSESGSFERTFDWRAVRDAAGVWSTEAFTGYVSRSYSGDGAGGSLAAGLAQARLAGRDAALCGSWARRDHSSGSDGGHDSDAVQRAHWWLERGPVRLPLTPPALPGNDPATGVLTSKDTPTTLEHGGCRFVLGPGELLITCGATTRRVELVADKPGSHGQARLELHTNGAAIEVAVSARRERAWKTNETDDDGKVNELDNSELNTVSVEFLLSPRNGDIIVNGTHQDTTTR